MLEKYIEKLQKIKEYENEEYRLFELDYFLSLEVEYLDEELEEEEIQKLMLEILDIIENITNTKILEDYSENIINIMGSYIGISELNRLLDCFQYSLSHQIAVLDRVSDRFFRWEENDNKNILLEIIKSHSIEEQLNQEVSNGISKIWSRYSEHDQEKFITEFFDVFDFNIGIQIWNGTKKRIQSKKSNLLNNILESRINVIYGKELNENFEEWVNENIDVLEIINVNLFDDFILKEFSFQEFKNILINPDIQNVLVEYKENKTMLRVIANALKDDRSRVELFELLEKVKEYYSLIKQCQFAENATDEEIKLLLKIFVYDESQIQKTDNEISIERKFEIIKSNFELELNLWETLSLEERQENLAILERIIKERFGAYLPENLDKNFFEILNNSIDLSRRKRAILLPNGVYKFLNDDKNVDMVKQMTSPIFTDEIMAIFPFDKMIQILAHPDIEEKILRFKNSSQILKIIEYTVNHSKNWNRDLDELLNNMTSSNYYYLIDEISNYDINELPFDKLIQVLGNSKNYFGIENIDDVINFQEQRKKICIDILNGNEPDFLPIELYEMSLKNRMKFALVELTFGIDLEDARELVKKYGTDIENIEVLSYRFEKVRNIISTLKLILSNDFDVQEFYLNNQEKLLNIIPDYTGIAELETECLNLYSYLYNESMRIQQEEERIVAYQGKEIRIHEVTGDFNFFGRLEQGIDVENEGEEFIKSTYENLTLQKNGNCKTYMGQNYINYVQSDKQNVCLVIYNKIKEENSLFYASSTNIKSGINNFKFSPESSRSDMGNGIKLRIPSLLIDSSLGINEIVTKEYKYDETSRKFEIYLPEAIGYVQETNDTDIEKDEKWHVALMIASKLGKEIYIIPREKQAQRELEKLEEKKQKLLGLKDRNDKESDEYLIQRLIVDFNNNREGIITSQKLSKKYFTEEQHIEIMNVINERLEYLRQFESEKYEELFPKVCEILKQEIARFYSTSYDRTDIKLDIDMTRKHVEPYEQFLMQYEKVDLGLPENMKNELYRLMDEIHKTEYYDMNDGHSIEHIEKVMLFSAMLANNEGLSLEDYRNLIIASAFHDSARNGKEGDEEHAEAGARLVGDYYENNQPNPFNITKENIGIIQTAIHYHEHIESQKGELDLEEIYKLCQYYEVSQEYFDRTVKICELLKDADALDRSRFGLRNQNNWALDASYLRSQTSKCIKMIHFSEDFNLNILRVTALECGGMKEVENLPDSKISELQFEIRKNHLPFYRIEQLIDEALQLDRENSRQNNLIIEQKKKVIQNFNLHSKENIEVGVTGIKKIEKINWQVQSEDSGPKIPGEE